MRLKAKIVRRRRILSPFLVNLADFVTLITTRAMNIKNRHSSLKIMYLTAYTFWNVTLMSQKACRFCWIYGDFSLKAHQRNIKTIINKAHELYTSGASLASNTWATRFNALNCVCNLNIHFLTHAFKSLWKTQFMIISVSSAIFPPHWGCPWVQDKSHKTYQLSMQWLCC